MSRYYRDSHSLEEFTKGFREWGSESLVLRGGGRIRIHGARARLSPSDSWFGGVGPDYAWIKVDGIWYLTGHYDQYFD